MRAAASRRAAGGCAARRAHRDDRRGDLQLEQRAVGMLLLEHHRHVLPLQRDGNAPLALEAEGHEAVAADADEQRLGGLGEIVLALWLRHDVRRAHQLRAELRVGEEGLRAELRRGHRREEAIERAQEGGHVVGGLARRAVQRLGGRLGRRHRRRRVDAVGLAEVALEALAHGLHRVARGVCQVAEAQHEAHDGLERRVARLEHRPLQHVELVQLAHCEEFPQLLALPRARQLALRILRRCIKLLQLRHREAVVDELRVALALLFQLLARVEIRGEVFGHVRPQLGAGVSNLFA